MASSVQDVRQQAPIIIIGPVGGNSVQPQGASAPAQGSSIAPARLREADEIRPVNGRVSRPVSRSFLGSIAGCIWDLVCSIFSCICCCFTQRAPRRARGRQPPYIPPRGRPAAQLTDRQKVERVLAAPEDMTAFFTAFKALPANIQERVRAKVDEVHYFDISRLGRGERDDEKVCHYAPPVPRFASRDDAIDFFIKNDAFNRAARAELQKVLTEMEQNPGVAAAQPAAVLAAPVQPPAEIRQEPAPAAPPAQPAQEPVPNAAPVRYDAYAAPFAFQIDPKIYKGQAVSFLENYFADQNFFAKFNNLPKEVSQIIREVVSRTYPEEIAVIRGRFEFDRKLGRSDFVFKTESAAIDEFVRTKLHKNLEVMNKVIEALKGGNA